ncbi:sirohydrochlorin chelatase [Kitasatospora hibisci]|uniref:sirohydrochlorin chelatase n=1 Tax=Kitasatospora hibisci TaxID=3369522 RepID=UPI003755031C
MPPTPRPQGRPVATLVLVGGHESRTARDLTDLADRAGARRAVPVGRELTRVVADALASGTEPVCVVPMTLGRDRALVADTARAMQWLTRSAVAGRVALTQPFGTTTHLVGWLRAAAGARRDADALLVTARSAGPDEDAELYRIGRLVRQYGTHRTVEVAFDDGDPDVAEGIDRCRRLGARRVARVRAGFDGGLLSTRAVTEVLHARTARALHLLGHGDDGIASALAGDHGHSHPHPH